MKVERWKQIDELFDAVLEIPNERRDAFLSEKCGGDADLKKEILSLLKAQKATDAFLENSAMNLMAKEIAHNQTTVVDFSLSGKELGSYRIERALGAGGMGEVFLAYDTKLKRNVALKILPAEFVSDGERIKRFEREARTVSALNHPNIVTIYDVGQTDGINFLVTEYIEGKTVREIIKEKPSLRETLLIVSQTCEALAAAHASGIIHRDIKPENIMMRPDGYVKVLDFGLAKLNPQAESIHVSLANYTRKGMIIGTLAYMSPEQISDDAIDQRTDLWSLGVVLYEMLTGVKPFQAESKQAIFNAILSGEPTAATSFETSLPIESNRILEKALEKDKEFRYQTASDFRADLKRLQKTIDSSFSLSNSGLESPKKPAKNFAPKAAIVAGILILLGGLSFIGWQFFRKKSDAPNWLQAKNSQLTDASGLEGFPSLAPDGKSFVYFGMNGKNTDIFLQRVGGKNATNLTKDSAANDTMPVFSPDGENIAFRSEREPAGIYLMEATGENVRRVSDTGFHPSWSPDGKRLVVSDKASTIHTFHTLPNSSLWIIETATGEKKSLPTGGDAIQPSWSPNGHRIAFWFVAEGRLGEIATIAADGVSEPVVVAENAATDWNPVWSPDGKFLYFASDRSGNMNFWRVAIDEQTGKVLSEPEIVPTPSKYCRHLTFSHDGKILLYSNYDSLSNLQTVNFDAKTGKLKGTITAVTSGDKEVSSPHLSPNGKEFVIRSVNRTQEDLVIFNRDGTNWRKLTDDKFLERRPRWSPDGKRIAFQSNRTGKYQIWTINADGSNLEQMTYTDGEGASAPTWSPDGKQLIYTVLKNSRRVPYIIKTDKKWREQTPVKLPPFDEFAVSFEVHDWSDDGDKLVGVFQNEQGQIRGIGIFSFASAGYTKISADGFYPAWLKDNRRFIFADAENGKIFLGDAQTKTTTEIYAAPTGGIQHADVSNDDQFLYFRYFQIESDIWMLDASNNP